MYLNIILTILVVVLITISTGIYFWWKKYGKKIFGLFEDFKKFNTGRNLDPNIIKNLTGNHLDIGNTFKYLMDNLKKMNNKIN
jgi:hypothetical protein